MLQFSVVVCFTTADSILFPGLLHLHPLDVLLVSYL